MSAAIADFALLSDPPALGPAPGRMVQLLGLLITFKATSWETGGAFSLAEITMNPGTCLPLHRHADAESLLVLEGEVEFTIGRHSLRRAEGDFVQVPAATSHGFRPVGGRKARVLLMSMPGGTQESFFLEAGDPVDHWAIPPASPPDLPRIVAAGFRHGVVMLPPV